MKRVVVFTSTFPASDTDPVPAFVKDQVIWLKKVFPHLKIDVLTPHNAYSPTRSFSRHKYYDEYRFHYFWPFGWEKLVGRGIQPALKANKLLYFELPFLFIGEFVALWKYVRRQKPDVIFANWFTPQGLVSAPISKIFKIPFVFDSQASDVIVLKRIPFARQMVHSVCRRALAYTVPSKQTADKLLYFATDKTRQEIESKLHIVPLGTTMIKAKTDQVKKLRAKYRLEDKTVILFVGRLVHRKGVDLLLKAFAQLDNNNDSLRLLIAGDGQDRAALEKLSKKLGLGGRVSFTGYIHGDTKYALLSLADVVALPSRNEGDFSEGLPVVFMEAVSYGKVTVVSNVTGAHESVTDRENGFIFRTGSVAELKDKLQQAVAVSRSQDKEFYNAVRQLGKSFDWASIIKKRAKALGLDKK